MNASFGLRFLFAVLIAGSVFAARAAQAQTMTFPVERSTPSSSSLG